MTDTSPPNPPPHPLPATPAPSDDGVVVLPRAALNYALVAIAFFVVGTLVGRFAWAASSGTAMGALPEDFELVVERAVENALYTFTGNANPNQRYTVSAEGQPALGAEADAALVTIVEFSDFTCTFCGQFANTTLVRILETYGEQVRFVYRDFPILSAMSYTSAHAAQCAHDQGAFWGYHDALFANQRGLNEARLRTIAEELALDMAAWDVCMTGDIHREGILADLRAGQEIGNLGTPSFIINGRLVSGALPFEQFVTIIDEALAEAEQVG